MDSRHNDVRRRFTGELNYPFAEVGLNWFDPSFFKSFVEVDLFTSHALGLYGHLGVLCADESDHDLTRLSSVTGPVDRGAGLFGIFREAFQILIEMKQRFLFDLPRTFTKPFPVIGRSDRIAPTDDKAVRQVSQCTMQNRVG